MFIDGGPLGGVVVTFGWSFHPPYIPLWPHPDSLTENTAATRCMMGALKSETGGSRSDMSRVFTKEQKHFKILGKVSIHTFQSVVFVLRPLTFWAILLMNSAPMGWQNKICAFFQVKVIQTDVLVSKTEFWRKIWQTFGLTKTAIKIEENCSDWSCLQQLCCAKTIKKNLQLHNVFINMTLVESSSLS